jgi:hypothetical protein
MNGRLKRTAVAGVVALVTLVATLAGYQRDSTNQAMPCGAPGSYGAQWCTD